MKLYDLLSTMQDLQVEIHYYSNLNYKSNNGPCKELGVEKGKDFSILMRHHSRKENISKIDLNNCEVFYISFTNPYSRTLRINVRVLD